MCSRPSLTKTLEPSVVQMSTMFSSFLYLLDPTWINALGWANRCHNWKQNF